jgi:GDP-4-dehydro-6-deoxy-D-mannose reductase
MITQLESTTSILITGGTGFVGSHLVQHLQNLGYNNIHVTTFSAHPDVVLKNLQADHVHTIDLTDPTATKALFEKVRPEFVYHLASLSAVGSSFDQVQTVVSNNLSLQISVLEAVRVVVPTARVLVISSGEVYGKSLQDGVPIAEKNLLKPVNPYAVSKAAQELLSLSYYYSYQLEIVVARPFNHIGEGQTDAFVVPAFAKQIVAVERGQQTEVRVGNLEKKRDFLDVQDVVAAYYLLMQHGVVGEVYNIASGTSISVRSMLTALTDQAECAIPIVQDESRLRVVDTDSITGDASKLRALGWKPTHDLLQTLARILKYWRNQ